ncbi:hypothetical protein CK203_040233 [Vitis vinifera]|uniref:Uncharacterized protein n=1 Tax=Vitis vinifera TaxID=29760 RepID=A0A438HXK5_VITVI|nr:hypothetical protein CK203_040233 [Vitis vinifera]
MAKTRGGSTSAPQSSHKVAPVRVPLDAPPHLPNSVSQSRYYTRRAAATPMAPTQILAMSPPTKKAKTSKPGESSRAARDSQSQPPPTRRPILASSPIEGNSDCRARAFHDEAYFDHYVLRQQPELGDSYRLLERYHLVPFMTPPQFFYPRVALDFYQSMTTRGVPTPASILFSIDGSQGILGARQIAEAFHIPYAPVDPTAFRRWALLSEWDMSVEAKGHSRALFRISEGYYFNPHHFIMASLLHFEEKTLIPETHHHVERASSLDQWNQVLHHQHSPEFPEPREVPPRPLPSIFAPSTSAPSSPYQRQHRSDAPPAVPPTPEPPITIPGADFSRTSRLSFSVRFSSTLGLLPPAPPVSPVPSEPFASVDDFDPADDATPVAIPSTVAAEDPSYPPEKPTT